MAAIEEVLAAIYESYDRRHGLLVKCLALLTKMEEEFTVATTEETQDDVLDAHHHDIVAKPLVDDLSVQIHNDVVPPPTTTEEILIAVPDAQTHPGILPCAQIHLSIDSADEVDPDLNLVKVCGGSLLREKMNEAAGNSFVVIVDQYKPAPVEVVSFKAEHKLAPVRRVFDELPGPGNYIVVEHGMSLDMATALILDRKEEHTPARFTVESLHLVILLVSLRAYGVWRIPWHLCICARLYAARCACESTGVWRPPWPPPTVEQLLRLAWYVSEGEVVSGMQDYSVKWFVNDEGFRASLCTDCASCLGEFNHHAVLDRRVLAAREELDPPDLKRGSVKLHEMASLDTKGVDTVTAAGVPYLRFAACAHLYRSDVSKLQKQDQPTVVHVLEAFCLAPREACMALHSALWDMLSCSGFSHLRAWRDRESAAVSSDGRATQVEELKCVVHALSKAQLQDAPSNLTLYMLASHVLEAFWYAMSNTTKNFIFNPGITDGMDRMISTSEERDLKKHWTLLIVAEDLESEALGILTLNKLCDVIKVCAVRAPNLPRIDEMCEQHRRCYWQTVDDGRDCQDVSFALAECLCQLEWFCFRLLTHQVVLMQMNRASHHGAKTVADLFNKMHDFIGKLEVVCLLGCKLSEQGNNGADGIAYLIGHAHAAAGAISASFGSPADLVFIRMQTDSTWPAAQRRDYKNALHALYRITTDGAVPTVVRAMALNIGMLASCEQLFRDKLGAIFVGWFLEVAQMVAELTSRKTIKRSEGTFDFQIEAVAMHPCFAEQDRLGGKPNLKGRGMSWTGPAYGCGIWASLDTGQQGHLDTTKRTVQARQRREENRRNRDASYLSASAISFDPHLFYYPYVPLILSYLLQLSIL